MTIVEHNSTSSARDTTWFIVFWLRFSLKKKKKKKTLSLQNDVSLIIKRNIYL